MKSNIYQPYKLFFKKAKKTELTPAASKLIKENELSPEEVNTIIGTGKGGRIIYWDVMQYLKPK